VELEIIEEVKNEETFTKGKKRLLDFLSGLGIKNEAIESRFYSEMLAAKR
jgi:adenylate cyclase class IV